MIAMLNLQNYKHIIFDFDETIATLKMDWNGWFFGMAAIYKKYDSAFIDGDIENLQNDFYKKYNPDIKKECDTFSAEYENKHVEGIFPVKQSIDLIKYLDKNLYVWSSNYSGTVNRFLYELSIINKFKVIVGREMVELLKPEPNGFNKYFKNLGEKKEFLFIGNSKHDSGAAKNCGIKYLDVKDI